MSGTSIACIALCLGLFMLLRPDTQQVRDPRSDASVSGDVSFPVYYPQADALPSGYVVQRDSVKETGGAVTYSISIPAGKSIFVSQQQSPPSEQLDQFESQRLPLFTNVRTKIGTARVGTYGGASLTSLATPKTWILVSAPFDIDKSELERTLQSFAD